MTDRRAPRVGLVLGSGGLAGYAFGCAAVRSLHEATGWDARSADVVVGTSAGASIAAVLRGGISPAQIADHVLSLESDQSRMDAMTAISRQSARPESARPSSLRLVESELRRGREARPMSLISGLLPRGQASTGPVGRFAADLHEQDWPAEELWLVAIDLDSGHRRVFGRGDEGARPHVAAAVEASSAIPGYFRPVEFDGRSFIDGGIRSPNNADVLAGHGLDLVVIVSPQSAPRWPMKSPLQTILRSGSTKRTRNEAAELEARGAKVLVIEPPEWVRSIIGLNPMDAARMVPVFVAATSAVNALLRQAKHDPVLEQLRLAAALAPELPEIALPDSVV